MHNPAYIQRQDTKMRLCILLAVRLAVTMRFLAFGKKKSFFFLLFLTGLSYPVLSHNFQLGVTTVMNCISDPCTTIYMVLQGQHMKVSSLNLDGINIKVGIRLCNVYCI